jgi:hypothetical protein
VVVLAAPDGCVCLQDIIREQQREVDRLQLELADETSTVERLTAQHNDVEERLDDAADQVERLTAQRYNAEERLEVAADQLDEAAIAADNLLEELSRTCRKLDASVEAAGPLVDTAADMATPAVEAAVPCLRGRIQQLERELAGRKSLPAHTAPTGTICAVTCCENLVEVQLPCGNGHYLCRPCHGRLCQTGGEGGFKCPLCKGACEPAAPGGGYFFQHALPEGTSTLGAASEDADCFADFEVGSDGW